jgi:alkyl hydroperoxide reductase 1
VIAILAQNDAFVMSAWGKVNGVRDDDVLFLADTESKLGQKIGWTAAPDRNARFAVIIDHGVVKYAEKEEAPGVSVSGFDAVLSAL